MRFSASREQLLALISPIVSVVARTASTSPINATLRLKAEGGVLSIAASNGIATAEHSSDVSILREGATCVPARKLFDILRALSDGQQVDVSTDESRALITSGRSSFKLSALPAEDFPALTDDVDAGNQRVRMEIPQDELAAALNRCSYCIAVNDVRRFFNGLLFDFPGDGTTHLMASDGHRLAVATLNQGGKAKFQAIVPSEVISYLTARLGKTADPVQLDFSDLVLRIQIGRLVHRSQLINAKAPDYRGVIPSGGDVVKTSRKPLISALERAKIVANEKHHGVRLQLDNGQVGVFSENSNEDDSVENLDAQSSVDNMTIAFNVNYLLDALRSIEDEDVHVSVRDASASVRLVGANPNSHVNVVMPTRL